MGQKEDYALANRKRSAGSLMRNYSAEDLNTLAQIGDYITQRVEMGASAYEALSSLRKNPTYSEFLRTTAKSITPYQAETAYLLQRGVIQGIKTGASNIFRRSNEYHEKSLDTMVAAEDQRHLDSQEEFPPTAYHARSW